MNRRARRAAATRKSAPPARAAREAALRALHAAVEQQKRGELERAAAGYRRVLELWPENPDALHLLAIIRHQEGDSETAIGMIRRALAIHPNFPEAHNNLGNILKDLGRADEAAAAYRQATRLDPRHAKAHYNLGNIHLDLNRFEEAEACYRRALEHRPDMLEALNNLGNVLKDQGDLPAAASCYERALKMDRRNHRACRRLGAIAQAQGRFDEAEALFEKAVKFKPDYALAYLNLATIRRCEKGDALIARIQGLLHEGALIPPDRALMHFALGKCLDDSGAYDEAFGHYRAGNELRLKEKTFDLEGWLDRTERIRESFDRRFFTEHAGWGSESETPVFIVGMPRSGTTLVEQILASHPRVFGAGELSLLHDVARELSARIGTTESYPECVRAISAEQAQELAQTYLGRVNALPGRPPGVRRITDKAPINFRRLGLVALLFPRARVVHCRRDPLDVCLSCYFQDFQDQPFSHDLGQIGTVYRSYEGLMTHWKEVLPIEIHDIQYEELVGDTEATARRLIDFCDLDWDEACLAFGETKRSVITASLWQVRQPVYTSSLARWKRYETHLGPLIDALEGRV